MFQPRLIGAIVLIGVALQEWSLFVALSAILGWSALVPTRNPFDALYNRFIARPRGRPPLTPAPAPRRFAQGMAAIFMLAIGLALFLGRRDLAWTVEGLLITALAALVFGKFCLGSYVFLLLRGESAFANRTLPWVRASE
jgi:hypothetical protein